MTRLCFLDMDGVIADFVGGACAVHQRPSPYSNAANYGIFDLDQIWQMSAVEFWKPTCVDGFWRNLEKTPEADSLVEVVTREFGVDNICVLTSPSLDSRCVPEKRAWCQEHYPQLAKNMLFGSAKRFLAGPGRFLIDDRNKNIDDWRASGGLGILVPRAWNALWWMGNWEIKSVKHVQAVLQRMK